jgi:hypothetical protein
VTSSVSTICVNCSQITKLSFFFLAVGVGSHSEVNIVVLQRFTSLVALWESISGWQIQCGVLCEISVRI